MKGTLTKDPEFEKAHQEKDVLTRRKLPKNINFNHRSNKETIKTLWQADKDFINLKQHKMDFTMYCEKFKAMKKVVGELNHTAHGHTLVEILCKEQNLKIENIVPDEATQFIATGKEIILGMQHTYNECESGQIWHLDQRLRQGLSWRE